MNKFDRLLYILNKLDRRERVRVPEVAQELEISERTVYRYLKSLIEAGFPIYYDRERGTYAFTRNFSLRRALLETEEALVLALARKFLEPLLGEAAARTLNQIENKIIASPKEGLSHFTEIFGVQGFGYSSHIMDLLKDISYATREYKIMKIEYEREPGKDCEEREIEPYFVFFTGDFWYVHAWCRTKKGQRTFALDKIRTWQLTDRYFVPRKGIPSVEEIQEAFGPYVDETSQEIILHLAPEVKQYFLRRKWMKDQICRKLNNGWLEVRFRIRGLKGFKYWLYRWLPYIKVISPYSLREEIQKDLQKALSNMID